MALTFSGSTAAMGMSVAMHVGAIVAAGMHGAPATPAELAPMDMVIVTEPAPEPPKPPQAPEVPEPVNAPPVAVAPPVHHEAVAVHAVAATEPKPDLSPPAEAPKAMVSDDALPHFTIATSTSGAGGQNLAKTSGTATTFEGMPNDDAPYAEGAVDVPARPLHPAHPRYPTQAQTSGLEGRVTLEIVLSSSGVVQTVRALSRLGHGFEESALSEARKTPFSPAMKRGRAVPVRMIWTVEFQLQ